MVGRDKFKQEAAVFLNSVFLLQMAVGGFGGGLFVNRASDERY